MTEDPGILDRECAVLTRFLVGSDPTPYVVEKYRAAHETHAILTPRDPFELRMLTMLRHRWWLRRPVAAYSRLFMKRGIVNNKLILLVAILESSPPAFRIIDSVPRSNAAMLIGGLAWRGARWLGALLVGIVVLEPLRRASGTSASEA